MTKAILLIQQKAQMGAGGALGTQHREKPCEWQTENQGDHKGHEGRR